MTDTIHKQFPPTHVHLYNCIVQLTVFHMKLFYDSIHLANEYLKQDHITHYNLMNNS